MKPFSVSLHYWNLNRERWFRNVGVYLARTIFQGSKIIDPNFVRQVDKLLSLLKRRISLFFVPISGLGFPFPPKVFFHSLSLPVVACVLETLSPYLGWSDWKKRMKTLACLTKRGRETIWFLFTKRFPICCIKNCKKAVAVRLFHISSSGCAWTNFCL